MLTNGFSSSFKYAIVSTTLTSIMLTLPNTMLFFYMGYMATHVISKCIPER